MKKIIRVNFYAFRNEEWFQLFTEFRDLVLKYNPSALNIDALWVTFLTLYADADTALEIIRKSADTALMIEADHDPQRRSAAFHGVCERAERFPSQPKVYISSRPANGRQKWRIDFLPAWERMLLYHFSGFRKSIFLANLNMLLISQV